MYAACASTSPSFISKSLSIIRVIRVRKEEHSLILKFLTMIKVNWTKVAKVLKLVATVITSVLGTLAVQSCMGI